MPTYVTLFTTVLFTILVSSVVSAKFSEQDRPDVVRPPSILGVLPASAVLGCWLWALLGFLLSPVVEIRDGNGLATPIAALFLSAPAIVVAAITSILLKQVYTSSGRSRLSGVRALVLPLVFGVIVSSSAVCGEVLLLGPYPDTDPAEASR